MPQLVVRQQISWNTQNGAGEVKVQLQNGSVKRLRVNTPQEFAAVSSLLTHSPILLLDNGVTLEYRTPV